MAPLLGVVATLVCAGGVGVNVAEEGERSWVGAGGEGDGRAVGLPRPPTTNPMAAASAAMSTAATRGPRERPSRIPTVSPSRRLGSPRRMALSGKPSDPPPDAGQPREHGAEWGYGSVRRRGRSRPGAPPCWAGVVTTRQRVFLLVVTAAVVLSLPSTGSAVSPRTLDTRAAIPSGWANPVVITAPAPDCSTDRFAGYALGERDDRHAFEAAPCQGLWVTLTRSADDGCQWTGVDSSDQSVVTPLLLPCRCSCMAERRRLSGLARTGARR